jgi:SAM-dependent methyltransferase
MPAMDYALVADLYDLYASATIDVPFFTHVCQGHQRILELTSGTGRLSIPLIEAGIKLTCLDSSAEMLAVLKKKLLTRQLSAVAVYEMDLCQLELPLLYDLIFIPFNSFAEITASQQQQQALNRIYAHLASSGSFICTLHNPTIRRQSIDGLRHPRGKFDIPGADQTLVLSSQESYDESSGLVNGTQFYEIYDSSDHLVTQREVDIHFSLMERSCFESLAVRAGFQINALYGDYAQSPFNPTSSPFMIWELTKA